MNIYVVDVIKFNNKMFASIYVIWCTNQLIIFIQIFAMNFLLIVNILFF